MMTPSTDAHLVASVPKLLEALKLAETILAGIPVLRPDGKNPALETIRAAIAEVATDANEKGGE